MSKDENQYYKHVSSSYIIIYIQYNMNQTYKTWSISWITDLKIYTGILKPKNSQGILQKNKSGEITVPVVKK